MKDRGNEKPGSHLTDTNHDTETAMMSYPVNVTCLAQAKPSRARAEAGTKPNRKPPARAPRAPIERSRFDRAAGEALHRHRLAGCTLRFIYAKD